MVNHRKEQKRKESPPDTVHESREDTHPIRTCIGCRRKAHPREFFRISNQPERGPVLLEQGPSPGRSVYLCKTKECVEAGLGKNRLARSLKTSVTPEQTEAIKKELICKLQK